MFASDYIKDIRQNAIPFIKLQRSTYFKLNSLLTKKHIGIYREMLEIFKSAIDLGKPMEIFISKIQTDKYYRDKFKI